MNNSIKRYIIEVSPHVAEIGNSYSPLDFDKKKDLTQYEHLIKVDLENINQPNGFDIKKCRTDYGNYFLIEIESKLDLEEDIIDEVIGFIESIVIGGTLN